MEHPNPHRHPEVAAEGSGWLRATLPLLLLLVAISCREHIIDTPLQDSPPRTFLWLRPDSSLAVGVSRQRLHWWGEDPDGLVIGYLFAQTIVSGNVVSPPQPDTLRYTWTTSNDSTVSFPLDTLFRRFLVVVRGVDNRFRGLPGGSVVRLTPLAYVDGNDNGIFDGADEELPDLLPAMDSRGAALTFPVRNTPPSVSFVPNPFDEMLPQKQPDTTYTAATFVWTGYDFDGNNTLVSYRIVLNDTLSPDRWLTLSLRDTMVTLVVPRLRSDGAGTEVTADVYSGPFLGRRYLGQLPGLHLDALNTFFVQARDAAGEYSPVASMPSGTNTWYVRRPRAKLLLVSDYLSFDAAAAVSTYRATLALVPGGEFATIDDLNIASGLSPAEKSAGKPGALVPGFVDPALIHTFLLFDYVLWYTDQYPSLGVAQLSLFTYLQNGGKVLFSTSFATSIDPRGALRDFAPIDSVSSVDLSPNRPPVPPAVAGDSRIPANYVVYADSSNSSNLYPQLAFNPSPTNHSVFMRPVYRRSDARYIYHLQPDTRTPARYLGTPNVAVVDGQRTVMFIGLPLHILNNTSVGNPLGLTAFFAKALKDEFSPSQKVNRGRF